jgi:hypothetical protein
MADAKISALTGASTPLAGTEVLPIVQSSTTVKVSVANLTAGRAVSMASAAIGSGATTLGLVEIQTGATTAALWVQTGGTSGSYTILDVRNGANTPSFQVLGNNNVNVAALGTGLVYSNGGLLTSTNPSDARLKTDIEDLSWGLADVLALRPVSYKWKTDKIEQGTQYGFIAQEVQSVMPELIREFESADGTRLGLEKEGIYAAMVKAIQELTARVVALEARA